MYNEKNVLSCKTEESVVDCFSIRREAVVCYYGLLLRSVEVCMEVIYCVEEALQNV